MKKLILLLFIPLVFGCDENVKQITIEDIQKSQYRDWIIGDTILTSGFLKSQLRKWVKEDAFDPYYYRYEIAKQDVVAVTNIDEEWVYFTEIVPNIKEKYYRLGEDIRYSYGRIPKNLKDEFIYPLDQEILAEEILNLIGKPIHSFGPGMHGKDGIGAYVRIDSKSEIDKEIIATVILTKLRSNGYQVSTRYSGNRLQLRWYDTSIIPMSRKNGQRMPPWDSIKENEIYQVELHVMRGLRFWEGDYEIIEKALFEYRLPSSVFDMRRLRFK